MILGAIEISSRSVRFCVADVGSNASTRVTERFHTIKALPENLERLTAILMAEAEAARGMGVERLEVTAGADLRGTRLAQQLDRVCQSVGAGRLRIPSVREESAAVFAGVTVPDLEHQGERVAVALVGEDEFSRCRPLRARGDGGSPPVGRNHHVGVEVEHAQGAAPHGQDGHGVRPPAVTGGQVMGLSGVSPR